ncbi:hypothetical protein PIB30_062384, partial [Stylosanthes scabra]|nr:hypothetical protein [Stylosanthes scabra]
MHRTECKSERAIVVGFNKLTTRGGADDEGTDVDGVKEERWESWWRIDTRIDSCQFFRRLHQLPVAITFNPELRLTHGLRLREALVALFPFITHANHGSRGAYEANNSAYGNSGPSRVVSVVGSLFPRGTKANVAAYDERSFTIGARKNGPPGKYERWLSSASSGSVGLAMITDRTFQVQVQAWKVGEPSVKISVCLAFSKGQVFRCMSWRTRG